MLRKEGDKVSLASNGEEGIKLTEKDIFDLILMDIRMPRLEGISTLKKVKTISLEAIVTMITACAFTDTAIKAMKKGVYNYITKPFKVEEIKLIIKIPSKRKISQRKGHPFETSSQRPLSFREYHRTEFENVRFVQNSGEGLFH